MGYGISIFQWKRLVTIAVIFTLFLLVGLLPWNAQNWVKNSLGKNAAIFLFLNIDISDVAYQQIVTTLEQDVRILEFQEIEPLDALELLKKRLEVDGPIIDDVNEEDLPKSIDIKVHKEHYSSMDKIIKHFKAKEGVLEVSHSKDLVEMLDWWYHILNWFIVTWFSVMMLVVLIYLSAITHNTVNKWREEIKLIHLSGVAASSIRFSFFVQGTVLLVLALALANGIVFSAYKILLTLPFIRGYTLFFGETVNYYPWQELIMGTAIVLCCGLGGLLWNIYKTGKELSLI